MSQFDADKQDSWMKELMGWLKRLEGKDFVYLFYIFYTFFMLKTEIVRGNSINTSSSHSFDKVSFRK